MLQFSLTKILDNKRNDFKVINPNYTNLLLFFYQNKIYSYNFCTLLYSEMLKVDYSTTDKQVFAYKIIRTVGYEKPLPTIIKFVHYWREGDKNILHSLPKTWNIEK